MGFRDWLARRRERKERERQAELADRIAASRARMSEKHRPSLERLGRSSEDEGLGVAISTDGDLAFKLGGGMTLDTGGHLGVDLGIVSIPLTSDPDPTPSCDPGSSDFGSSDSAPCDSGGGGSDW